MSGNSFQFTPLREGRPPRIGRWWGLECISIHAPPRGATTPSVEDDAPEIFQFTPLREGRLHPQRIVHAREISIHAPPRGATSLYLLCWYAENISIHAPPRGATPSSALHSNVYVPFQFTPLREGRPMHDPREYPVSIFQFTPLREGRLVADYQALPADNFNSRPSARGDPSFHHFLNFASTFQFTPLREGRRQRGGKSSPMPRHFNSRPSARGDEEAHQRAREAHISIHAPPRGATVTSISSFKPRSEFQFTPLREGRRARLCQSPASYQFQFTPLREGRPPFFVAVFGLSHFNSRPSARGDASARNVPRKPLISIHAPPRGATKGNVIADERYIISIHAPPRGATATRRGFLTPVLFQFTPLREGRRLAGSPCDVSRHHFNSRPSARGDDGERVRFAAWCYFNSRPSARGDSHFPSSTTERGVFQFTPLREGRLNAVQYEHSQDYFNSRPSARGDIIIDSLACPIHLFQFTPLREGRPSPSPAMPVKFFDFNSRPSARGDVSDCSIADISTISIHAPPRGATSHPVIFPSAALFQFTPLREGRRGDGARLLRRLISIHAPPRGATAKDMQFLQIFCSTLTNQHGLTIMPRNLSRLFW